MKKYFLAGLIIVLPLIVTYLVVVFGLGLITHPFENVVRYILDYLHLFKKGIGIFSRDQLIFFFSKVLIIAACFAFILLAGFLARWVMFRSVGTLFNNIMLRIPLINKVYGPSKQLIDAVFIDRPDTKRQAVIVPYPSPNQRTVGIATGEYTAVLGEKSETFVSVFVPSTPNATVGYLCNFSKDQVVYLEMSADDALKYVMGFGMTKVSLE